MCLEDDKNKAPFLLAKKNGLNPPTVGIWWERLTEPRQLTRQATLNRLGSDWFAAGKSDLRQHASLRDDVERHVSRHAAVKV